jgi:soluble lytic murein transglycosylase-like protein
LDVKPASLILAAAAGLGAWILSGASRARAAVLPSRPGAGGAPTGESIGIPRGAPLSQVGGPTLPANPRAPAGNDPITRVGTMATGERAWGALADDVADAAGVPRSFVRAVVTIESAWRPDAVNTRTHDYGLFQINAQHFGKVGFPKDATDATNPDVSARAATRLLAEARQHWRSDLARIAAEYNGGYRLAAAGPPYPNASYVSAILAEYQKRGGVVG